MDPVQGKITDLLEPEAEKRILAMRQPGIEPGSTAWKAAMLTTIPPTLGYELVQYGFSVLEDPYGVQMKKKTVTAVTRIRTWVTAATTQGPNH